MLRGIDHIVVAVPDLEAAAKDYGALGFTVIPGGRHPVGTHNALIAFSDGSYVELIAFYEANASHRWWDPLQQGGGLVDFCLQTDDLAGDTAAFRRAGVAIDDPAPLSRVRPDGHQLRWVLSIPRPGYRGVAPFLIEDETPREERIPRQQTHANGVSGIATVTVAVEDVATVRRWFTGVLGRAGREIERLALAGAGVSFEIGPHVLEFLAPKGARATPLGEWLRRRGPSPYAATLRTRGPRTGALDETRTHSARLSLV